MDKKIYKMHVRTAEGTKYAYVRAENIKLALEYTEEQYPGGEVELVYLESNSTII